jgi:hypothetical protein
MLAVERFERKGFLSVHPNKPDYSRPQSYAKNYLKQAIFALDQIVPVITEKVWSDSLWIDGGRKEANWCGSYFCVLDFDGDYPLEQAKKDWADTVHLIAPTKRHGEDGRDRFRLIAPWQEPILSFDQYRYNTEKVASQYPCDSSCVDGARFFWPSKEISSIQPSGYLQPTLPLPLGYKTRQEMAINAKKKLDHHGESGVLPSDIQGYIVSGFTNLKRNKQCFKAVLDLVRMGWSWERAESFVRAINGKTDPPMDEIELTNIFKSTSKILTQEGNS